MTIPARRRPTDTVPRSGTAVAYDNSAAAWQAGPDRVYQRLAGAMVAASPVEIAGRRILDVGAGTGAASRAALAAGAATVVAADMSAGMLRAGRMTGGHRVPVVADACRLPFRSGSFDLVVAGCCLGHLPNPLSGLREARRVAGGVVASAFANGWTHPAKGAVDAVMRDYGFVTPDWYVRLKRDTEPLVEDPDSLRALAAAAGWSEVRVAVREVPTGLRDPADLVAWRLGMAHLAPFVASLSEEHRAAARRHAELAVTGAEELVMPLVILACR